MAKLDEVPPPLPSALYPKALQNLERDISNIADQRVAARTSAFPAGQGSKADPILNLSLTLSQFTYRQMMDYASELKAHLPEGPPTVEQLAAALQATSEHLLEPAPTAIKQTR